MKCFNEIILGIVLLVVVIRCVAPSQIEPKANSAMEGFVTRCAIQVAQSHFPMGSIISIVKSGMQNVSNANITKATYNLIVDKMMQQMRWTIMVKNTFTYTREKRVKLNKFN